MAYSTISKPSLHFNTHLYTGNGSTQSITGVGFQPDWTILKGRNASNSHNVYDAVRGAGKTIVTDANYAESTDTARLTSFDSDGFSLGSNANVNENNINFVSWNWKANGAGSANTDGSINSTVSANTTSGFSIVKYTGTGSNATVGHGLGAVPKMILIKELNNSTNWIVYHAGVGNGGGLQLNTTITTDVDGTFWNSTTPTSSVFSLGVNGNSNGSSDNYIAYCFADITGYSKFGSYTGNGNESGEGAFIYTGFKPAFFMVKNTSSGGHGWYMVNNKVDTDNPTNKYLVVNTSAAEASFDWFDLNSNGIKIRGNSGGANSNGDLYIYMAFAEEPLVANVGGSIPATAR